MTPSAWLERSGRALATARRVLTDDPDAACSRAYYAMFYAARAALLHIGQADRAAGRTHGGMIAAFGEHLVKTGSIAVEHGRAFAQVADLRVAADYDVAEITAATAAKVVDRADGFVRAVGELVEAGARSG